MTFDSDIYDSNLFNYNRKIISNNKFTNKILKNKMLNELFFEIVPPILHEDDHNSMKFSVENRSPFLDKNLFDACYSIPTKYLINNGYNKYILRKAMHGIVNETVLNNRRKVGFNTSITKYLKLLSKDEKMQILDKKSVIFNFIKYSSFEKIFKKNLLTNSESKFLFNFINTKFFLEKFN